MELLEWTATGLCLVLVLWLGGWLLLDKWREVRHAKYAGQLAQQYLAARRNCAQPATEYTWPIVAQQPMVFYENAPTMPIPLHQLHPEAIVQRSVPLVVPVPRARQAADVTEAVTEVLPVVRDEATFGVL